MCDLLDFLLLTHCNVLRCFCAARPTVPGLASPRFCGMSAVKTEQIVDQSPIQCPNRPDISIGATNQERMADEATLLRLKSKLVLCILSVAAFEELSSLAQSAGSPCARPMCLQKEMETESNPGPAYPKKAKCGRVVRGLDYEWGTPLGQESKPRTEESCPPALL